MKFKSLFIALFLTVTLISCKDEAKNQENGVPAQEVATPTDSFKVLLTLVAKENDDFCLLYTEDGSLDFKDGVWKVIKGSYDEQTVEFSIPDDGFPTQLRLDLGKNQAQQDILIKSIKFDYRGKVRELKGAEIGVFFRADPSKCSYDTTSGIVKAIVNDGKRETPSLYPNESILAAELPKLK